MSINCILSQSVELEKSVFDFTVKDIYGEDFNFSSLQGKKIMIVTLLLNVA